MVRDGGKVYDVTAGGISTNYTNPPWKNMQKLTKINYAKKGSIY
jgi:hypothetical protein